MGTAGDFLLRFLGLVVLVAVLVGMAAHADAPPDSTGAPTKLHLELIGTVPSHCGFKTAPAASAEIGDLSAAGQYTMTFALDCNAMFDIRISSANGGLAHVGGAAPTGFAGALDYDIALSYGTDLGTVDGACMASALAGGCALAGEGLSSGDGVALGTDGQLVVSWTPPPQRLFAGQYQDSIVITVEVRP